MGHKSYDKSDFSENHQIGFSQSKRKPVQNGLKKSMIPTARVNGIKENSKDILEENVEMDKARNNIEGWWRPVSEKEDQDRDGLVEMEKARNNIEGWWRPVSEKEDQDRDGLVEDKETLDTLELKNGNDVIALNSSDNDSLVTDLVSSTDNQGVDDYLISSWAASTSSHQGTSSRSNEIKEKSKDILEENVETGMSCSTIIDDKQDKARNNIEVVPVKEDQVPVIVKVFSEEGQVRDGLVEDDLLDDILIEESLGDDYIMGNGPSNLMSEFLLAEETLDTLELKNSTDNDSLVPDIVSSTVNRGVNDNLIPSWAASTGIQQGTSLRLNEIKEKSKDIQEENVEIGMSCSTIIDDKQDKARNNIEDWWRPVSEKVPVIVEVFQKNTINDWRDPLGRAIVGSSNRFLELYQF